VDLDCSHLSRHHRLGNMVPNHEKGEVDRSGLDNYRDGDNRAYDRDYIVHPVQLKHQTLV
jgi:hypothetical protein